MKQLILFFILLLNYSCESYDITSENYYEIIQTLIPSFDIRNFHLFDDEFKNNSDALCDFMIYETGEDNGYTINILSLDNSDTGTNNNILPTLFYELSNIKVLILSELNLATLHPRLSNLSELELLDLTDNNFEEIPKIIFSLPKLKTLSLDYNKFNTIPPEIIEMRAIEKLCIRKCDYLKSININIFKIKT
ncbi:Leucine rich repeat protein, partial [Spraguea lophii 42_110]